MKLALIVIALLAFQAATQAFPAILALTWLEGHCEYLRNNHRSCDPVITNKWDGRSFNIHGYWPSFNSSKNYGKLDIALFYGFADDLNRLWPARSETPKNPRHPTEEENNFLWNHEWSKHGKDFAELYSKLFGVLSKNPIGNNKLLQQSYFREVVNYVKTLGVKLTSRPANKAQLASQLGVPENSLIPRCLPSGNLQEVRVCTEMAKVGSRLQIRAVACKTSNSNCRGIQLAGFK